ncbi:MAG: alpha/beta hydrolase [Treponema sp.]|nr:alpha/beta hydrolase [Treponema sp.]
MNKKKYVTFITISIATAVILFSSILAYVFASGSQHELTSLQIRGLISSIRDYHFSQYPDFNELYFSGGKGYEFRNNTSDRLIIYLGGFGWGSATEAKWSNKLIDVFLAVKELTDRYTFFVPEKFEREIGVLYGLDTEERHRYTIGNLLDNYYKVISEYLSQNNYESIIIYGASEGAFILPLLYTRLNNHNIKALVSDSGGGGLAYFEQQQVLLAKLLKNEKSFSSLSLSKEDRTNLQYYYETWIQAFQTQAYSDSIDFFLNSPMTYKWFDSIVQLRLFEYYERISIPILFIHGNLDTDVPVETTQYIENNLPFKPFDFCYYPEMTHNQIKQQEYLPQNDIIKWISKINP